MKSVVAIIFVTTLARAAVAEPEPTYYAELGAIVGATAPAGIVGVVDAAYGMRQTEHRWLRFALGIGVAQVIDSTDVGPFVEARAGYEERGCVGDGFVCGAVGLDGAAFFVHQPGDDDGDPRHTSVGLLVGPRFGFELGDRQFRLHFAIETGLGGYVRIWGPPPEVSGAVELRLDGGFAYLWR
jgi:hypothetical protein